MANQAASWIKTRAPSAHQPALVLDIDETALSNWEIIVRDDFGRPIAGPADLASAGPWGWAAWDQLGRDPAIMPALEELGLATVGWEHYQQIRDDRLAVAHQLRCRSYGADRV